MMAGIGALIFIVCVLYKYDPRTLKMLTVLFIILAIIAELKY